MYCKWFHNYFCNGKETQLQRFPKKKEQDFRFLGLWKLTLQHRKKAQFEKLSLSLPLLMKVKV